ncbi:MAG: hypothetical protein WDN49_14620 [Acetobacteraceae bacterium]
MMLSLPMRRSHLRRIGDVALVLATLGRNAGNFRWNVPFPLDLTRAQNEKRPPHREIRQRDLSTGRMERRPCSERVPANTDIGPGPQIRPVRGIALNVSEQGPQALGNSEMRDNGVAQFRVGQVSEHRRLTAAITSPASEPIMVKPRILSSSARTSTFMNPSVSSVAAVPQDIVHRHRRHADRDALAPRLAFGQAYACERRVGEHDMGNQAACGPAVATSHVVPDDPEIIDRHMRELGTPRAFADRPGRRAQSSRAGRSPR